MHELSLCRAIADTAIEHAGGKPVRRINVRIGHFRQVIPDTMRFCWDMRVKGTVLDEAELAIEAVPAVIRCLHCDETTELTMPVMRCGSCEATTVELISGEEFLIESIDLFPTFEEMH